MNWLRLHVSNVCNFKCPNCHVFEMTENLQPNSLMTKAIFLDSISTVINQLILLKQTDLTISLYGGETLANKKLIREVLSNQSQFFNNQVNLHWILNTNGSLLNEDDVQFFHENNVEIHISVDGKQTIHNLSRPLQSLGPTFHLVEKALSYIKKYSAKAQINSYVTPININHLNDIISIASEYNIPRVYLDQFYSEEMQFDANLIEKYKEVYLYSLLKNVNLTGPWSRVKNNLDYKKLRSKAMIENLVIDINTDGSFFSSLIPNSKSSPLPSRNLKKFLEVDYFIQAQNTAQFYSKDCKDCPIIHSCFGIAKEQVWYHINDNSKPDASCSFFRNWIAYLDRPIFIYQSENLNIISLYPQNEIFPLINEIELIINSLEKKLWKLNQKINVNILADHTELKYASKQFDLPQWAKATTSKSTLFHIGFEPCTGLKHELVHLFINQLELQFPNWAIEGICEWLSGQNCTDIFNLDLKDLEASFIHKQSFLRPDENPSYQTALKFFLYLETKFGYEMLCQQLLNHSKLDLNQWLLRLSKTDLKSNFQAFTDQQK